MQIGFIGKLIDIEKNGTTNLLEVTFELKKTKALATCFADKKHAILLTKYADEKNVFVACKLDFAEKNHI